MTIFDLLTQQIVFTYAARIGVVAETLPWLWGLNRERRISGIP